MAIAIGSRLRFAGGTHFGGGVEARGAGFYIEFFKREWFMKEEVGMYLCISEYDTLPESRRCQPYICGI